MSPITSRRLRWALCVLPCALAACGTLLPPSEPVPEPWLPLHPLPEPGEERSPRYPPN